MNTSQFKIFILFLFTIFIISCSRDERIVGKWFVEENEHEVSEVPEGGILQHDEVFNEDGSYEMSIYLYSGDESSIYTWLISKGTWDSKGDELLFIELDSMRAITIDMENGLENIPRYKKIDKQELEFNIIELSDSKFEYKQSDAKDSRILKRREQEY